MTALQVYGPFADAGFEDLVRGFFKPLRETREGAATDQGRRGRERRRATSSRRSSRV